MVNLIYALMLVCLIALLIYSVMTFVNLLVLLAFVSVLLNLVKTRRTEESHH